MAGSAPDDNDDMPIRLSSTQRARLARAAAIQHLDLEQFVIAAALREADAVIAQTDTVRVSVCDFTRILALLEDPPAPNARLKAAIAGLPDTL